MLAATPFAPLPQTHAEARSHTEAIQGICILPRVQVGTEGDPSVHLAGALLSASGHAPRVLAGT